MATINKIKAKKRPVNSKARNYYANLPFSKRDDFKTNVINLMQWTNRQFNYRFMKGLGWTIGDAEKIERGLNLKSNTLWKGLNNAA